MKVLELLPLEVFQLILNKTSADCLQYIDSQLHVYRA